MGYQCHYSGNTSFGAAGPHGSDSFQSCQGWPALGCLGSFALTSRLPLQELVWKVPQLCKHMQGTCMFTAATTKKLVCAGKVLTCHYHTAPASKCLGVTFVLVLWWQWCLAPHTSFFSTWPCCPFTRLHRSQALFQGSNPFSGHPNMPF